MTHRDIKAGSTLWYAICVCDNHSKLKESLKTYLSNSLRCFFQLNSPTTYGQSMCLHSTRLLWYPVVVVAGLNVNRNICSMTQARSDGVRKEILCHSFFLNFLIAKEFFRYDKSLMDHITLEGFIFRFCSRWCVDRTSFDVFVCFSFDFRTKNEVKKSSFPRPQC